MLLSFSLSLSFRVYLIESTAKSATSFGPVSCLLGLSFYFIYFFFISLIWDFTAGFFLAILHVSVSTLVPYFLFLSSSVFVLCSHFSHTFTAINNWTDATLFPVLFLPISFVYLFSFFRDPCCRRRLYPFVLVRKHT